MCIQARLQRSFTVLYTIDMRAYLYNWLLHSCPATVSMAIVAIDCAARTSKRELWTAGIALIDRCAAHAHFYSGSLAGHLLQSPVIHLIINKRPGDSFHTSMSAFT